MATVAVIIGPQYSLRAQELEEVIVTAERRATKEQTTAISIDVLRADELAANRTQNIADLQQTTPNVAINQPGIYNSINIRGVGNSAIQPSITTGVAVFQDGLLAAETITLGSSFLDLGTVEVLRGPQGTFVGASSTGGAIRLNSVRPDLSGDIKGYVEALGASRSDVKLTGAINLPIAETLAARVAFNQEKRDSYFDNRATELGSPPFNPLNQPGNLQDLNARVSLLWVPSDRFDAIWRTEINRTESDGSPFQPNPRTFINTLGAETHSKFWDYDAPVDPTHDPRVLSINALDTRSRGVVDRYSLEWNYHFGNGITLRSLTGFVHNENRVAEDDDGSFANANLDRFDIGPDNNYYSQEVNLISPEGPLNWILGSNWFYRDTAVRAVTQGYTCGISSATGVSTPCPLAFTNVPPTVAFGGFRSVVRSVGVFGQVNWELVKTLELTLGGRMNYDNNISTGTNDRTFTTQVLLPAFVPGTAPCTADVYASPLVTQYNLTSYNCLYIGQRYSYKDHEPTWKVGLNWTPSDNHFVYAFWSRGYKSGGVDTQGSFEPEQVDDYELGWKGAFADGRVRLSLGSFYMKYENMQQAAFRASTVSAGTTVYNVGDSTIKGVEAALDTRLAGFGIQASIGYTHSALGTVNVIDRTRALDSDVRAPGSTSDLPQCSGALTYPLCVDWTPYYRSVSGESNLYSPELSYTLALNYDFLVGDSTWTPGVTFSHTDKQDTNLLNRGAFWSIDKRDLLNVSLTYTRNDWLVQAYCNNCSDETYIASVAGGAGATPDEVLYGIPRNYGIRVRKNF